MIPVLPLSTPQAVCRASLSSLTWPYWSGTSAQYVTSACCSFDCYQVGNLFGNAILQGFSLMNERLKQKVEAAAEAKAT